MVLTIESPLVLTNVSKQNISDYKKGFAIKKNLSKSFFSVIHSSTYIVRK